MCLRVVCCTWNVKGSQPPDEDFRELLHLDNEEVLPDIVAVGLQEVDAKPQSLLIEYIKENSWVKILQAYLGAYGLVKLRSIRMLGMVHLVAVHTRHLPHVREIRAGYCKTALLGLLGTKGAVALRFKLYGESFCFINSHFAAHADQTDQRNLEYESISQYLKFQKCTPEKSVDHEWLPPVLHFLEPLNFARGFLAHHDGLLPVLASYVFWLGDLNYRINESVENIQGLVAKKDYASLWPHDQLIQSYNEKKCFVGFTEGQLLFPPTYKYNPGTNDWDTVSGKYRKPAWCDRVLWKEAEAKKDTTQMESYTCCSRYLNSDHKPVLGSVMVDLKDSVSKADPEPIDFKLDMCSLPWYGNEDGLCVYVVKNYKTYSWDWVALYRVGFQHLWDYEMYEWAVGDGDEYGENGCAVLFDCLPEEPGHFVMCYYSYRQDAIIASSEPFEHPESRCHVTRLNQRAWERGGEQQMHCSLVDGLGKTAIGVHNEFCLRILAPRDEDKDPVEVSVEQPPPESVENV